MYHLDYKKTWTSQFGVRRSVYDKVRTRVSACGLAM